MFYERTRVDNQTNDVQYIDTWSSCDGSLAQSKYKLKFLYQTVTICTVIILLVLSVRSKDNPKSLITL